MVRALSCLHNCLIDEKDDEGILEYTARDQYYIVNRGGINIYQYTNIENRNEVENNKISVLLDGGDHFGDKNETDQYCHQKVLCRHQNTNPRQYLLKKIQILGIENRSLMIFFGEDSEFSSKTSNISSIPNNSFCYDSTSCFAVIAPTVLIPPPALPIFSEITLCAHHSYFI